MYLLGNNHSGIVFYVKFGWWLLVEKKRRIWAELWSIRRICFENWSKILNLAVNHVKEHAIGVELF
jgi:hypothetical protein